ncbi:MAG: glycosyltransferase [Bacteroidales bacterium]
MTTKKARILVAPLDWGLGHATRCLPVIHTLIEHNFEVILAADGRAYELLMREFPQLDLLRLEGSTIRYPCRGNLMLKILAGVPGLYRGIKTEQRELRKIIKAFNIQAVISDNRYGLFSDHVFSVFIGHQMMIKLPGWLKWAEWILHRVHIRFINRFDECWIPDFPGSLNLSGDLSHKYPLPPKYHFAGPLSRFSFPDKLALEPGKENSLPLDLLVILSGPEPQRTILEKKLLSQLKSLAYKTVIVRGVTEKNGEYLVSPHIRVIHHADTRKLQALISSARRILCRPGYSSIMDLAAAGKKAMFIPTPGQTEQEYLADYFYQRKLYYYNTQKDLNLEADLKKISGYNGFSGGDNTGLLTRRIDHLSGIIEAGIKPHIPTSR